MHPPHSNNSKKGYKPRSQFGNLHADSNIYNYCRNYFNQLLNVHKVRLSKNASMCHAGPNSGEVEIATDKL